MGIIINNRVFGGGYINGKKIGGIVKDGAKIYSAFKMPKIVTFHDGTDEEIAAMLDAHYVGALDISNYWKVGDERQVHLNELKYSDRYQLYYRAQDVTIVIIGFNHDDLVTPVGKKNKAAITVRFKYNLNVPDSQCMELWQDYPRSYHLDGDTYLKAPLRQKLNNEFYNTIEDGIKGLIKEVNKKCLKGFKDAEGSPIISQDKCWLVSYPELAGETPDQYYLNGGPVKDYEGTQYEWFKTKENRRGYHVQYESEISYWTRSHCYYAYKNADDFAYYYSDFDIINPAHGGGTLYIIPAFCL